MSRPREYETYVPFTVYRLVVALIADQERRQAVGIKSPTFTRIDTVIDSASRKIEATVRREILCDLAHFGAKSREHAAALERLPLSRNAYYRRRKRLIFDIAKGLGLI